MSGMTGSDPKADLHRYLQSAREAVLWKLDGLSEYDVRRPMTPTGTNLLGLVKHLAGVELGYFGDTFGRPPGERLPSLEEGAEPNADLWATAEESREDIVGLYHRAWAHSDATIAELPLDTLGRVPWWPPERREATLHRILVHVISETNRHAPRRHRAGDDRRRRRAAGGQREPPWRRRGVVGGVPGAAGARGPGGRRRPAVDQTLARELSLAPNQERYQSRT
jgi:uncharacterized damage-inducible protein DinB